MRGKRSKQYRRLLKTLEIRFGFREPYQVLVDSGIVIDTARFKMDLVPALERTLHGTVKPMITQCSMRHLYAAGRTDRSLEPIIDHAKTFERRRCGHRPEDFPEPLSELECLTSVVDDKKKGTNRHRYVVASQEVDVRRTLREVKATPLIYVARSVMIMEPLSEVSVEAGEREERAKFRAEIKKSVSGEKRKRDGDEDEDGEDGDEERKKKKTKTKQKGPKGPNPLAVKKKKKDTAAGGGALKMTPKKLEDGEKKEEAAKTARPEGGEEGGSGEQPAKRKRKRKHKGGPGAAAVATEGESTVAASVDAAEPVDA